jgi:hypothetical protein
MSYDLHSGEGTAGEGEDEYGGQQKRAGIICKRRDTILSLQLLSVIAG